MKPSSRNLALAWSVRNTRQTHSLSKNEMGWMQATTSISLGEEGEEFFLDIHSDRAHREFFEPVEGSFRGLREDHR